MQDIEFATVSHRYEGVLTTNRAVEHKPNFGIGSTTEPGTASPKVCFPSMRPGDCLRGNVGNGA